MLKLSKSAIGLLNKQYRSVLSRCLYINLVMAFCIASPVFANNATTDFNGNGDSKVSDAIISLKTQMGNTIGTDKDIGTLYVNEKQTNSLYSHQSGHYSSWIINYNDVYIGYKNQNGRPVSALDVEISNRHNTNADNIFFGGGVITNGGDTDSDALLVVNNVKFMNNTASSSNFSNSDPTMYIASGGVINNFSVETANVTNNQFLNNYVMSGGAAKGGAIYNGTASNQTGAVQQGNMNTENNLFQGNYAGNITSDSILAGFVGNAIANEASGGAIYNTGILNSKNDIFKENFTTGKIAYGGAIYNGPQTNNTGGTFVLNNTNGEINFEGNYANSDVADGASYGGAIYNAGNFTSQNSIFLNNHAYMGGAIYNTGNYSSINEKFDTNYGNETGGAIINTSNFTISGNSSFINNYIEATTFASGYGGAITNTGTLTINDYSLITNNSVKTTNSNSYACGGVIANSGNIRINGNFIDNNYTIKFIKNNVTSDISWGGAIYNAKNGTIEITNVLFSENSTNSDNDISYGGAIYSEGTINISNSDFISNKAEGINAHGGAIFNINQNMELTIKDSNFIENAVSFKNEDRDNYGMGGAIYNGSSSSSYLSILSISSENQDVEFLNNKVGDKSVISENVVSNGGAIFNEANGLIKLTTNGKNIIFDSNFAQEGGAIYNKATGITIDINGTSTESKLLLSAQNGNIYFKNNTAGKNGGAIYNQDTSDIEIKNNSIYFENNSSQKGGAIYNDGENLNITLSNGANLIFNENVSSEQMGGAIYNTVNGNIDISLSGKSNLIFGSHKDDIYNLGTISVVGDTSNSQLTLNSTFGGEGTYNLKNIQLVINENAYIDNLPTLNLENNLIHLNSGSYINLDKNDTITDNSFYISEKAVINYQTDISENVNFANNIINSGLININDNVHSNVIINTLTTDHGLIKIDVDKDNLVADRITINNKIYGKTHVLFDNSNLLALNENERIYFAQTQAEQSLSDYSFSADINGNIYEIGIGNEVNNTSRDWFFYRTGAIQPEIMAYIDIPRASVEQSRALLFDISRLYKGGCECRTGKCNVRLCNFKYTGVKQKIWAKPIYRFGSFEKPVETDFNLYGLDFGYDVQKNLYHQFGFFGSIRNGKYENEGKAEKFYANYNSQLDITSVLAGAYYRRYFGDLYINGALYGGLQMVDAKTENNISASSNGINLGAQTEMGYDIKTTKRSVLTPSVKATYDYIKFDDIKDNSGKKVVFDDIHDIELEAGMKFEYQFNEKHQLPTTGYIKPSFVHVVSNGGDVTVNNTIFEDNLEDGNYWRVEIGADADIIRNFSIGGFGNYTSGSGYDAWTIGGHIRYIW